MIEGILGSRSKEQVMFYIFARQQAYAREIAVFYETSLSPVQNQLNNLEIAGILVSKNAGRTRLYMFNPRYPFYRELDALIGKAVSCLPEKEKSRLTNFRTRPRRNKKP